MTAPRVSEQTPVRCTLDLIQHAEEYFSIVSVNPERSKGIIIYLGVEKKNRAWANTGITGSSSPLS